MTNATPGEAPSAATPRRRAARIALSLALAAIVALGIMRQGSALDWRSTVEQLRETRVGWLLLAVVVFYTAFAARCVRWSALLANAGFDRTTIAGMPSQQRLAAMMYRSWFINAVTIARAGDAVRGIALTRRAAIPMASVLGTILAERIIDLVVLTALLVPAIALAFHHHLPPALSLILAVAAAITLAGPLALRLLLPLARLIDRALPERWRGSAVGLASGAADSLHRLPWLGLLTLAGWMGEGLTLFLVARAAGAPLPLIQAIPVALIAALLTTVPITPGGLGLTEAGMIGVLDALGIEPGAATAIALLSRAISFGSVVVGGLAVVLIETWLDRRHPA